MQGLGSGFESELTTGIDTSLGLAVRESKSSVLGVRITGRPSIGGRRKSVLGSLAKMVITSGRTLQHPSFYTRVEANSEIGYIGFLQLTASSTFAEAALRQ